MARPSHPPSEPPPAWQATVEEAVGRVIEFWGFKRNHGRLWALLYLVDESLTAAEIGRRLGLSKGAVSLVTRELLSWGVIRRSTAPALAGVCYEAERDMWQMIENVVRRRERQLVEQVIADLRGAERQVMEDASLSVARRRAMVARLRRLRHLGEICAAALTAFLRSRRLDLRPLRRILVDRPQRA